MNQTRRSLLAGTLSSATLAVAVSAGLLRPRQVFAAPFSTLYDRSGMQETLRALSSSNPMPTAAIRIDAPDIAEDGASVYFGFSSTLPNVDTLVVFVERNPQPFIAAFRLGPQVLPDLKTRIKLSQTSLIWVVARSEGRFYKAAKLVKVTVGGCGIGVN